MPALTVVGPVNALDAVRASVPAPSFVRPMPPEYPLPVWVWTPLATLIARAPLVFVALVKMVST